MAERKIPAAPLFERLGNSRGAAKKLAEKLNVSEQVVANWKRRGSIPWAELHRIAAYLGISPEQYLTEAGLPTHVARQPGAQYTLEAHTLLEDFRALPEWLQEHVARKTAELRRYAESLPPYLRDGMRGPPKDPERYRTWERDMEDDMRKRTSESAPQPKKRQ